MKLRYIPVCMLFQPLLAHAAPLSLEAQLIGAWGKLEPDRKVFAEPTAGFSLRGVRDVDEVVAAPGFGLQATYELNPSARVGGEVAWVNYDQGNSKPQYQDTAAALNASYDFYHINIFAFYGLAGFSYHWIDPSERTLDGERTVMDNVNLLNLDLGLGSRLTVATNVLVDIAYRFSDSVQTDDVTVDTTAPLGSVRSRLEDLGLRTNQFTASVGYQF